MLGVARGWRHGISTEQTQVLSQLASKSTKVERLEPTPDQRQLYDSILQSHVSKQLRKSQQKQKGEQHDASRLVGTASEAENVFVSLRKAANHPLLLRSHYSDSDLAFIAEKMWKLGHFGGTVRSR